MATERTFDGEMPQTIVNDNDYSFFRPAPSILNSRHFINFDFGCPKQNITVANCLRDELLKQ